VFVVFRQYVPSRVVRIPLPLLAGLRLVLLVGFLVVVSAQFSPDFNGAPRDAVAGTIVALSFLVGGLLARGAFERASSTSEDSELRSRAIAAVSLAGTRQF